MPDKAPAPVEVVNADPLVVELAEAAKPKPVSNPDGTTSLPATTTRQEDKITEGQRTTSLLWESVQATIAVSITLATIYCAIAQINSETIVNAFFFIVATYFTRTNHTRVGGLGQRIDGVYRGR